MHRPDLPPLRPEHAPASLDDVSPDDASTDSAGPDDLSAPETPQVTVTSETRTTATSTPVKIALLAVGLLLIGLNLRIGVASVGPLLGPIREDLRVSSSTVSLLTTIPVVAFGAFAFATPRLTRAIGMHRLLGVAMLALGAGIALRLQPSLASLFAGTLIVGAAIAVGNVLMPAVIKNDFAHRAGLMMGLYSTTLFVGAALGSGLTVPLQSLTGAHWRTTLALWAIPALVAFVVWLPQTLRAPGHQPSGHDVADAPSTAGEPSLRALLTDRVALAVTALMGTQSLAYYATLTWVPTLLQDHGMSAHDAGLMLSYSSFPGILASLVTPALARRMRPTWLPIAVSVALCVLAYLGLAIAPVSLAYLWMTLLGLGQGAAISLALSYLVWRSPDTHHTGQVSTMAQGFGYLFAGLGPVGLGALHTLTHGWGVPLLGLGALMILQLVVGIPASRDRHVLAAPGD